MLHVLNYPKIGLLIHCPNEFDILIQYKIFWKVSHTNMRDQRSLSELVVKIHPNCLLKKSKFEVVQLVLHDKTFKYQYISFEFIHWDLIKEF